tara:strand:- start:747 stop:959 length:213 start_codon:yes stop_codon:yes gene_type:complete
MNHQAAETSQRRNASELPREDVKGGGIREALKKRNSMHITPDLINIASNQNGAIKEETVEEDKDDDVVRI